MLRYFIATIFLFFFISNINIIGIGPTSKYMWVLISLISIVFFVFNKNIIINKNKGFLIFISLYTAFIFWMLFAYLRSDVSLDSSFSYLTLFLIYISTFFVIKILLARFSFENVIIMLSVVYVVQALSVILFFLNPLFKSWILNTISDSSNIDYLVSVRSKGISGSGANISVYLSIGFFYLLYLIGTVKRKSIVIYSFFGVSLLLLAIFLSGRTGFVIFGLLIFSFSLFYLIDGKFTRINKKFFIYSSSFLIILPLAFYFFSFLYGIVFSGGSETIWGDDKLTVVTNWVFSESNMNTSTIKFLIDHHIVINGNWIDLVFGNPDFLASSDNHTDIGYLRMINDFGIIGFVLYYFSLFILFITPIFSNEKISKYMLVGLMVSLFFVEAKEPFLHKHLILSSYLFAFLVFGVNYKKKSNS
ncbi:hypothetical protein GLP37_18360 [Photobacterium phosphoreum]|uniref:O-antigen polymerase n=1 Tax=Photobacterium phosphoreum TaxID=659 RepID=UPI001E5C09C3|nr:O-antigen polymerase [Photobacterium phosphoreum]MCD9504139.1 hypothetical protein [Photobacterium phosphoreum]